MVYDRKIQTKNKQIKKKYIDIKICHSHWIRAPSFNFFVFQFKLIKKKQRKEKQTQNSGELQTIEKFNGN